MVERKYISWKEERSSDFLFIKSQRGFKADELFKYWSPPSDENVGVSPPKMGLTFDIFLAVVIDIHIALDQVSKVGDLSQGWPEGSLFNSCNTGV